MNIDCFSQFCGKTLIVMRLIVFLTVLLAVPAPLSAQEIIGGVGLRGALELGTVARNTYPSGVKETLTTDHRYIKTLEFSEPTYFTRFRGTLVRIGRLPPNFMSRIIENGKASYRNDGICFIIEEHKVKAIRVFAPGKLDGC